MSFSLKGLNCLLVFTKSFTIPTERGDLINKLYDSGDIIRRIEKDTKVTIWVKGYRPILEKLSKEIRL